MNGQPTSNDENALRNQIRLMNEANEKLGTRIEELALEKSNLANLLYICAEFGMKVYPMVLEQMSGSQIPEMEDAALAIDKALGLFPQTRFTPMGTKETK